jgi:hypothetical protein
MTPEVRLSPDGQAVAIRNRDSQHWPWNGTHGCVWTAYSDEQVADWTPLLPVSSEDGA